MQLQAKRPPGRADRKAGAYASEIMRMRTEGYTYAAIVEALQGVGITTSEGSLRREVKRFQKHRPHKTAGASLARKHDAVPTPTARPRSPSPVPVDTPEPAAHGRQLAEAFFSANPSNPMFPPEESS